MVSALVDQEVAELEGLIICLDTAFEAGEDCINPLTGLVVSDAEYDKLRKRLEDLSPESGVLKQVTASKLVQTAKKVKHDPPMTSISKAIGPLTERTDMLADFISKVGAELKYPAPEKSLVQAYKRDGVAISLIYTNGRLTAAGLRPRNGVEGEDVTENIQYVEGVPLELWEHDRDGKQTKFLPVSCCIRGELECKKSTFRKVVDNWHDPKYGLDSEPKNPRNYTAGSIRQFTNPKVTKERQLSFTAYSIYGWTSQDPAFNTVPYKTEVERAKFSNAKLRIPFVQVRPFRWQDLKVLEDLAGQLDYEVDGIVISVDNLEDSEQMGTHGNTVTGNPKSKIAWKFSEESVEVEVDEIVWTPGRTGKLTPVLKFDPVQLDGTTVSQCTGHSLGFIDGTSKASLGVIKKWTKIKIIKSGKIIPKVIEVIKSSFGGYGTVNIPTYCPSCKSKLEVRQGEDGKDLVCHNEYCGVRAVAKLVHFLSNLGVKGISDGILTNLYKDKLVEKPDDLYGLDFLKLKRSGFSDRQSLLILARLYLCNDPAHKTDAELVDFIDKTKKVQVPAWQLFAALGISGAGKTAGQALVQHFGTFEKILDASLDELKSVDGLGDISAEAIMDFTAEHDKMISNLLKTIEPQGKKIGKLTGKTFVFTGGFDGGKELWQNKVLALGATVSSSVGKTTDFVVVGVDAGSKEVKAKELGIPMLSSAQLEKML